MMKIKIIAVALFSAALLSGCFNSGEGSSSGTSYGEGNFAAPQTIAEYSVQFHGPGGHSQGNYGRVNALHAASRALVKLSDLSKNSGNEIYVQALKGGASVNSIASDASFTVGLVSGNATQFLADLQTADAYGKDAENAFRNVTDGQISNQINVSIRVDPPVKVQ